MRRRLTPNQKQFVKGIIRGKSQRKAYIDAYNPTSTITDIDTNASHLIKKPNIQEVLAPLLEKHNLTIDRALKPIDDALNAEQTNEYTGEITPDHRLRLSASDRVLKLHGVTQQGKPTNLVNIINLQKNEYLE